MDDHGITPQELAWTAHHGGILYDRIDISALGAGEETTKLSNARCFNCGSPRHIVSACTSPRNYPLIALSRAMYNFFKSTDTAEPERLHEYEERKTQRLRFCDAFDAGAIRGDLLRDALGLGHSTGFKASEEELPWFWRMLQWGYPPGWVGVDPKSRMRSKIDCNHGVWTDGADTLIIIDDPSSTPDSASLSCTSYEDAVEHCASHVASSAPKRWVRYPTTLFSSDHLPIYSGSPLPPLGPADDASSTFTSDRMLLWERIVNGEQSLHHAVIEDPAKRIHPWRLSGAFSAFGPGWQQVNAPNSDDMIIYQDSEDDTSDMDLSE